MRDAADRGGRPRDEPRDESTPRTRGPAHERRGPHAATLALALALAAAPCGAEKFVPLGEQPDGSQVFVQATPATVRKDGRLEGWFRTLPATPAPVTDEFGFARRYRDMLALNVADCLHRRMGAAAMVYRDAKGEIVARFDAAPGAIDFRDVKSGTLADSMLTWLCAPRPKSGTPPPSAAQQSPYK
jgi:hypothetical protein